MKNYYKNIEVRRRIIEYLGGDSPESATCFYLTRCDVNSFESVNIKNPAELDFFFENGLDIGRSILDCQASLAHLDIEYVNFDFPAEPYLDPERSFVLQEPVIGEIKKFLTDWGLEYLHLVSGRGHHFIWQVPERSESFRRLVELGYPATGRCNNTLTFTNRETVAVPSRFGKAFAGMELIMEFLAMRIKKRAAGKCALPVELTAVEAGARDRGREIVSIDISEYGDCPATRMIRVPFSAYLKPLTRDMGLVNQEPPVMPPVVMIPALGMPTGKIIEIMRDPLQAAELARHASVRIPSASSRAIEGLIESYLQSDLRKFHDCFYSQEHEPHEQWPRTYDRTPLEMLPPCVRRILEQPNNLLLIPGYIQLLVRSMLALGWHPRHIAGLIRSKYERDYDWGWYWLNYDAASRADFYTRIFAGLFATGVDDLVDFNCLSTQEKGFCATSGQHCSLDLFKKSLLARRKSERLASRPFNRMFFSDEHI